MVSLSSFTPSVTTGCAWVSERSNVGAVRVIQTYTSRKLNFQNNFLPYHNKRQLDNEPSGGGGGEAGLDATPSTSPASSFMSWSWADFSVSSEGSGNGECDESARVDDETCGLRSAIGREQYPRREPCCRTGLQARNKVQTLAQVTLAHGLFIHCT